MVIKGKSIGHAAAHARHLMREDQNDRVEFLEFDDSAAAPTLKAVFSEYQAIAEHLTKAKKGLYIAALNPEIGETLTRDEWKIAVDILEKQLGLDHQPRTVILHEKKGREHVHVVWQRADIERERVVDDQDNYKAHEHASREIEAKFGLEITQGVHTRDKNKDPRPDRANTKKEHQQAERIGIDLAEFKTEITQAFVEAEHGIAFTKKLEDMGCYLARGDKKNIFMIVLPEGEALKLSSTLKGISVKEWKAKLSPLTPHKLKSVSQITKEIKNPKLDEAKEEAKKIKQTHQEKLDDLKIIQGQELERLQATHRIENMEVKQARNEQGVTGIFLVLEYVTGITWLKSRQHNTQDRARVALQEQAENSLKQEHKNQLQGLEQKRQLDLHEIDETHKEDMPPLKARFELSREELARSEFSHAVKAHDDYFDQNMKKVDDEIRHLNKHVNRVEKREVYLGSLNQKVAWAFDTYFNDGGAAYEKFRQSCGLVKQDSWRGGHVNKSNRSRNFKKSMEKLIKKPEEFGELLTPVESGKAYSKRCDEIKQDIEAMARRIHYMTVKIENERANIPFIKRQLKGCNDRKLEQFLDFSDERLAHLRQIEQKSNNLNAKQLKTLSKTEKQQLRFAQENMKDQIKRDRADEYLKQRDMQDRTQNRNKAYNPDEPHL